MVNQATAAPRPRRLRRRLAFVAAALGVGLLATFVLLEAVARLFWVMPPAMAEFQQAGLYVASADGGTSLVPGYRGTLQLSPEEPVTSVAINAMGMRGGEIGARHAGEQRLLVAGDSLVFGYGVEVGDTFVARLERLLRAAGRDATVGNGGVSGFNSFEVAARIAELRPRFEPDAVLFCIYLGNDAFENRNRDFAVVAGQRFSGPWAVLMRDSLRARLACHSRALLWWEAWLVSNAPQRSLMQRLTMAPEAMALREGFPSGPGDWGATHAGLFLDVIDEDAAWPPTAPPVLPRVIADFRAALAEAREAAAGAPVAVLVLPTRWHLDDAAHAEGLRGLNLDPVSFRRGLIQQRLAVLCADVGLPMFDATPWLEATADHRAQFLSDGGHFSPAGHAAVAAALADAVQRWLP